MLRSVSTSCRRTSITLALARRLLTGPGARRQRRQRPPAPDADAAEPDTGRGAVLPAGQPFRKGRGTVLWTRDLDLVLLAARVLDRRRATQVCVTERDGMYKQRAMDHAWACPTIIARKGYPYIGDHGARTKQLMLHPFEIVL